MEDVFYSAVHLDGVQVPVKWGAACSDASEALLASGRPRHAVEIAKDGQLLALVTFGLINYDIRDLRVSDSLIDLQQPMRMP